jgi:hypothetical protein
MDFWKLQDKLNKLGFNINSSTGIITNNVSTKPRNEKIVNIVNNANELLKMYENSSRWDNKQIDLKLSWRDSGFWENKRIRMHFQLKEIDSDTFLGDLDNISNNIKELKESYPEYDSLEFTSSYDSYDNSHSHFLEGSREETEEEQKIRQRISFNLRKILRYSKWTSFLAKKEKESKEYKEFLKLKEKYEG